jgi:hypothetical protein
LHGADNTDSFDEYFSQKNYRFLGAPVLIILETEMEPRMDTDTHGSSRSYEIFESHLFGE